ncbi:MAG: flavodoxin family protein [Desulfosalsimonadaceae bacterium]|nr:flavodoxin family protein [Desulfosalsimonadaceae bacterium]
MKVIAFNGSARKDGNTAILLNTVLADLETEGVETELYPLSGKKIHGCTACYKCYEKKNRQCAVGKDAANECIEKMLAADGILLGSPTYFADISPEMKALIDRAGLVSRANGDMFMRKIGAAVVVARRGGAIHAFDSMNHFFLISQMIIPGSNYWNMGFGLDKGDVAKDEEALQTMKILGQNMAWLLKKTHG